MGVKKISAFQIGSQKTRIPGLMYDGMRLHLYWKNKRPRSYPRIAWMKTVLDDLRLTEAVDMADRTGRFVGC